MKLPNQRWLLIILLFSIGLFLARSTTGNVRAEEPDEGRVVIGFVEDTQVQPVSGARITARESADEEPLAESVTQADGRFVLPLPLVESLPNQLVILVERAHFETTQIELDSPTLKSLDAGQPVFLTDITLERRITPAFWIATLIFGLVLVLIAMGRLHNTLASLLGASLIFAVSYLGPIFNKDFFVFDFSDALGYVDWNVIFLIMGMMIVIAVVERTGIFQWSAFMAYRISRGRTWLMVLILMIITGIASAFLDNVTTMLLMTPITIQIALSLGINPLAFLIPEVMASNVVGISTLVGTPTNILIGSYGDIGFTDFLINLTPGVVMATIGLIIYSEVIYRRELRPPGKESGISKLLLATLAERGRITQPDHLKKAAVVGAGMIALFVFGEQIHLLPAVTAIMGATALLVWIKPDIEEMIEAVDWTTLVFFIALFICVGAVQEVGLISIIADGIGAFVGDNLVLAIIAVTWLSAFLSTIIANIPFTAAMLPVIAFLTAGIPGANNKVLYYALSVGSAMGGNGSLIGASANMVTAGIAERAGFPITYGYFLKKGLPALVITVTLATVWLLIRFL